MDASTLRGRLIELGAVATTVRSDKLEELQRLSVAVVETQRVLGRQFVASCRGSPLLMSYSGDPTSLLVASSVVGRSQGHTLRRKGRSLQEILMQRLILKSFQGSSGCSLHCMVGFPRPLSSGKSAWHVFSAATEFVPMARQWEHFGFVIVHVCCDRALHSALEALLQARCNAYYDETLGPSLAFDRSLLRQKEITLGSPCCMHAAQNALKWALQSSIPENGLKELHVAIESLRHTFSDLIDHLYPFLLQHIEFRSSPHSQDEARQYWAALGIEAPMLDRFAVVHPLFSSGRLWIAQHLREDTDMLAEVSFLLLFLCRWSRYTESRFASLGHSTRALLASQSAGLDQLVSLTRADPKVSHFHLHGYGGLTVQTRKLAAITALASWPAETFLHSMFQDDRLGRQFKSAWETLIEEVDWLAALPASLWKHLVEVIGDKTITCENLRHEVVGAAYVSLAYMYAHIFIAFTEHPWSLIVDIEKSVASLTGTTEPFQNEVAEQLRCLLRAGASSTEVRETLLLMREVSWSTTGCEQQHGSTAAIHQGHPDLELKTLLQRSFLHACRALFQESPASVKRRRLDSRIAELQSRRLGQVTGRHMFLANLHAEVVQNSGAASGRLTQATCKLLMQQHAGLYARLSPTQRVGYENQAHARQLTNQTKLEDTLAQSMAERQLFESRQATALEQEGLTNLLSHCRYDDAVIETMYEKLTGPELSEPFLAEKVAGIFAIPEAPSQAQQEVFETHRPVARTVSLRPSWLSIVCAYRGEFINSIFLPTTGLDVAFLFMFAKQSPQEAWFLEVKVSSASVKDIPNEVAALDGLAVEQFRYVFSLSEVKFAAATTEIFPNDNGVFVIKDAMFVTSKILVANSEPLTLDLVLEQFPPSKQTRKEPEMKPKLKRGLGEDVLAEHPWIREYVDVKHRPPQSSSGPASSSHNRAGVPRPPVSGLAPDQVEEVWESLKKCRSEWANQHEAHTTHFATVMRGGAWTLAHVGTEVDSIAGMARGGEALQWCSRYGLPKMASFSIRKFESLGATRFAHEWCRKMQYLFDLFLSDEAGEHHYSSLELASYVPSTEWQTYEATLEQGSALELRAKALRELAPLNPSNSAASSS